MDISHHTTDFIPMQPNNSHAMRQFYFVNTCCLLLFLSACKYNSDYKTINAGNKFTLTMPSWMKEVKDLKPGAEMQYANRYRNIYAIGEEVPTGNFIDAWNSNISNVRNALESPLTTDSLSLEINGMPAVRVEMFGKMSGENIYFTELFIDAGKAYYHICIWTRGEERKLRFKEDITNMVQSFKTI